MSISNNIIASVCEYYNVTREEIMGRSRKRYHAIPRQMAMFFHREIGKMFFDDIGEIFDRHHSVPIHNYDTVKGLMRIDKQTRKEVEEITALINKREEGEIIEGVLGDNDNNTKTTRKKRTTITRWSKKI